MDTDKTTGAGEVVKRIEITSRKPSFASADSPLANALEAYFRTGKDKSLSGFGFDHTGLTPFRAAVMDTLRKVPAGTTVTYGELARRTGRPGAARAVGSIMARNPVPVLVPCHRVVATDGLGGFSGGLDVKRMLLRLEGAQ